jgi:16S rRNA G1207 methylase RsmC
MVNAKLSWASANGPQTALWQSVQGWPAPATLEVVTQNPSADRAYRLLNTGTALLWQGDFHQGKQLLEAVKRRAQQAATVSAELPYPERFHRVRLARAQTARLLGRILVLIEPDFVLNLPRAPQIQQAFGMADHLKALRCGAMIMPLTELLGVLSAYQWSQKGVYVHALGACIHPRYGVFAPTRQDYLAGVMSLPLPTACSHALDVGTGTGVIAALLAKRGVDQVIATDLYEPALLCAKDNMQRLGLSQTVQVLEADLFVPGQFDLVVCNPPWLPGTTKNALDAAIYDPNGRMLTGFLTGVRAHLTPKGQAWLVLSDLAEHFKLRTRDDLLAAIEAGGLVVSGRHDAQGHLASRPDPKDPLADARAQEITSVWQLSLA